MQIISKEQHIYAFSTENKPDLTVESGSELIFETYDCYRGQLPESSVNKIHRVEGINPATGPVAIHGAEPGDTLKVSILSIDLDSEGTMYIRPGSGVLRNCVEHAEVKKLPIRDGKVHYNDNYSVPIKPMIGVIGVSPQEGEISTISPGNHGGNMDTQEITEGAILYLPISVPGANLAMGDLHAIMGDGEVPVCGVEIGGRVKVKVELIKGVQFPTPVLENKDNLYVIASALTADEACQAAAEYMFAFLKDRVHGLSANDLICLMGGVGNVRISQLVNPLMTAKYVVPKSVFPVSFEK